jgi:hypothetical protein
LLFRQVSDETSTELTGFPASSFDHAREENAFADVIALGGVSLPHRRAVSFDMRAGVRSAIFPDRND